MQSWESCCDIWIQTPARFSRRDLDLTNDPWRLIIDPPHQSSPSSPFLPPISSSLYPCYLHSHHNLTGPPGPTTRHLFRYDLVRNIWNLARGSWPWRLFPFPFSLVSVTNNPPTPLFVKFQNKFPLGSNLDRKSQTSTPTACRTIRKCAVVEGESNWISVLNPFSSSLRLSSPPQSRLLLSIMKISTERPRLGLWRREARVDRLCAWKSCAFPVKRSLLVLHPSRMLKKRRRGVTSKRKVAPSANTYIICFTIASDFPGFSSFE